ncbi:MAG: ABC transporter ATP-binding protein [Lachnospiraceae bacterium]
MGAIKASIFKYKYLMIGIFVLTIAGVLLETAIPLLVSEMIDHAHLMPYHYRSGTVLMILIGGGLLFSMLAYRYAAYVSAGFAKDLRTITYQNVQLLTSKELDRLTNISIVTRLTTDIANLQNSLHTAFNVLIRSLIMMIATLVVAVVIAPIIGIFFLVLVVLTIFLVLSVSKKALPLFGQGLTVYDGLNQSIQENVTATRVIKAYTKEEQETAKFSAGSQLMYGLFVKAEKVMVLVNPILLFTINTCLVLVAWAGSRQIENHTMSTGDFIVLFTYTANLLTALVAVTGSLSSVLSSLPSLKRVAEISDTAAVLAAPDQIVTMKDGSIEFKQVSFRYNHQNEKYDLKDINVTIRSGATIGIIGGTGSGKSTFGQLIPGLYLPEAGEIIIGGHPASAYDNKELKSNISMVMQKSRLFSGTVEENLKWGNQQADREAINRALKIAGADGFVAALEAGFDTHVDQGGTNFSGGQRQRLCIARALLKDFRILILDDATGAVDSTTEKKIRQMLKEAYPAATKLIISQKVSTISDCDQIIVLENGRICGFDTHEELLNDHSVYQEIFLSQQGGGDFDVG